MINLSIIIPAYNEEERIENTLNDIFYYINDFKEKISKFEIIVVVDGNDKTEDICKKFDVKIIKNAIKYGKGYAIKRGVDSAIYDYVLFMDADNATRIEELHKFFPYLDKYDFIIGSRNLEDSIIMLKQPFHRVISGLLFSYLVKKLFRFKIEDTQCGFKLIKRKIIYSLFLEQKENGWAFDVELIKNALKHNIRIKEIGIDWYNKDASKLHIFKDGFKMLKSLYMIKNG